MIRYLTLYPRLTPTIFIADVFHTIAEASSIIFHLRQQFFADAKIFGLERLSLENVLPTFTSLSLILTGKP